MFNRFVFPAPRPSYAADTFPEGELLHIPRRTAPNETGGGTWTFGLWMPYPPVLHPAKPAEAAKAAAAGPATKADLKRVLRPPARTLHLAQANRATRGNGAGFAVLYVHPNASDIGMVRPELRWIGMKLRCHVLAVEYRGYGMAGLGQATADEEEVDADVESAMAFLCHDLGVPPRRVVVVGRSIGTGPSTRLASLPPELNPALRPGGLFLQAPFCGIQDCVKEVVAGHVSIFGGIAKSIVGDRFPSAKRIGAVDCPIAIQHGTADAIVPYAQGEKLFEIARAAGRRVVMYPLPGTGHNDIDAQATATQLNEFVDANGLDATAWEARGGSREDGAALDDAPARAIRWALRPPLWRRLSIFAGDADGAGDRLEEEALAAAVAAAAEVRRLLKLRAARKREEAAAMGDSTAPLVAPGAADGAPAPPAELRDLTKAEIDAALALVVPPALPPPPGTPEQSVDAASLLRTDAPYQMAYAAASLASTVMVAWAAYSTHPAMLGAGGGSPLATSPPLPTVSAFWDACCDLWGSPFGIYIVVPPAGPGDAADPPLPELLVFGELFGPFGERRGSYFDRLWGRVVASRAPLRAAGGEARALASPPPAEPGHSSPDPAPSPEAEPPEAGRGGPCDFPALLPLLELDIGARLRDDILRDNIVDADRRHRAAAAITDNATLPPAAPAQAADPVGCPPLRSAKLRALSRRGVEALQVEVERAVAALADGQWAAVEQAAAIVRGEGFDRGAPGGAGGAAMLEALRVARDVDAKAVQTPMSPALGPGGASGAPTPLAAEDLLSSPQRAPRAAVVTMVDPPEPGASADSTPPEFSPRSGSTPHQSDVAGSASPPSAQLAELTAPGGPASPATADGGEPPAAEGSGEEAGSAEPAPCAAFHVDPFLPEDTDATGDEPRSRPGTPVQAAPAVPVAPRRASTVNSPAVTPEATAGVCASDFGPAALRPLYLRLPGRAAAAQALAANSAAPRDWLRRLALADVAGDSVAAVDTIAQLELGAREMAAARLPPAVRERRSSAAPSSLGSKCPSPARPAADSRRSSAACSPVRSAPRRQSAPAFSSPRETPSAASGVPSRHSSFCSPAAGPLRTGFVVVPSDLAGMVAARHEVPPRGVPTGAMAQRIRLCPGAWSLADVTPAELAAAVGSRPTKETAGVACGACLPGGVPMAGFVSRPPKESDVVRATRKLREIQTQRRADKSNPDCCAM